MKQTPMVRGLANRQLLIKITVALIWPRMQQTQRDKKHVHLMNPEN